MEKQLLQVVILYISALSALGLPRLAVSLDSFVWLLVAYFLSLALWLTLCHLVPLGELFIICLFLLFIQSEEALAIHEIAAPYCQCYIWTQQQKQKGSRFFFLIVLKLKQKPKPK